MTRTPIPQRIHRGERKIVIFWSDDHEGSYRARDLRLNCQLVGNYAIKIDWSDGHNTGIYTYERLWEMCGCEKCRSEKGE
jgi:DUF971 family protein